MIFQPLIENSIYHGLNDKLNRGEEDVQLIISGFKSGVKLCFIIKDNGKGMTENEINQVMEKNKKKHIDGEVHIGIKNIHERIQYAFGEEYGLSIESKTGEFTTVRVELPAILKKGEGLNG